MVFTLQTVWNLLKEEERTHLEGLICSLVAPRGVCLSLLSSSYSHVHVFLCDRFLQSIHPSLCIIFRYVSRLLIHRRPKLGVRFIRLCMRVELDSVNCLKMVQNRKIKITYLIVVVFLCVLGVSGGVSSDF